ncbi:MAG: PH domain-containing protein [Oscillospiraceae bacterium]|jgi:putative membrane protein|nr:PH domain-containing protein [Oscillospiraceae bacterium]
MFDSPQRNHPSLIVERLFSVVGALLILLFSRVGDAEIYTGRVFTAAYWRELLALLLQGRVQVLFSGAGVLLLLLVFVFFGVRTWKKTFFHVADGVLLVEKKTLMKKQSSLPVEHIATVNLESNFFEQLIGTSKVKLDLNSFATASATDFTFVLKKTHAEQFKAYILGLKQEHSGAQGAQPVQAQSELEPVIAFSFSKVIRHAALSITLTQIILAVIVFLLPFVSVFFEEQQGQDSLLPFILFSIVIVFGKGLLSALRYARFSLQKDERRIYLDYGLLRKRSYSFTRDRINAVTVKQPFFARLFGLYYVEAAVLGLGNENNETSVLSLLVNKSELQSVLDACAPGFLCAAAVHRSPRAALVPLFLKAAFFAAVGGIALWLAFGFSPLLFGLWLVFCLGMAYLSFRTKSACYDEKVIHFSSGILNKKMVMLQYADVQKLEILQNRMFARLRLGRLRFHVLASLLSSTHITGYVAASHLEACAEKIGI